MKPATAFATDDAAAALDQLCAEVIDEFAPRQQRPQKEVRVTENIRKLPDLLAGVISSLEDEAKKAAARLSKAKERHGDVTQRINEVATVIEQASGKSEDLLNQMMGGNGGPTLEDSPPSAVSSPSAEPPAS